MANRLTNIFRREAVTEPAAQNEAARSTAQGGSFASNVVQVNSVNAALGVAAWYCAGERLANTMSQLVLEYQKRNEAAHGGNYELDGRGDGGKLNYLLQVQPNPTMNAADFWKQMTLARFHEGNAVVYIERDAIGSIRYLWLCSSASLNPITFKYTITYNTNRGPITDVVDDVDVIHWKNTYSLDHGLTGVGTLRYAAHALTLAATSDKQTTDNASKGGKVKLLLQESTDNAATVGLRKMNKDQKNKQRDDLQDALNEGKDVLLMSGLMDAKVISQDAAAQQLLETRKYSVSDIARYTGVLPWLLMDNTSNTYKAPEQAMQQFFMLTIAPMARALEAEFNCKILMQSGYPQHRFHFNDKMLMRLDPVGRANISKTLLETGIMCPNELRKDYDLSSIEGGDRHYISTNLQALDAPKVTEGGNDE